MVAQEKKSVAQEIVNGCAGNCEWLRRKFTTAVQEKKIPAQEKNRRIKC
jgi:hypothetical protein